ncbi:hypothetical protein COLO4_01749, partial [Corchorus olitorius]
MAGADSPAVARRAGAAGAGVCGAYLEPASGTGRAEPHAAAAGADRLPAVSRQYRVAGAASAAVVSGGGEWPVASAVRR